MSAAGPILIKKRNGKVMIVSPSAEVREKISNSLGPESRPVTEAVGGAEALLKLRESDYCTLLLDPNIEDLHTEELVATIRARYPGLNITVLEDEKKSRQFSDRRPTGVEAEAHNPDGPIAALRNGSPVTSRFPTAGTAPAASGALKAPQPDGPIAALWARSPDLPENLVREPVVKIAPLPGMIGASPKMQQIYRLARLVAPRDTAVLIVGPTGTGKELVARGIHELSRRSQRPFVVVNCAAIPDTLLEAELFGFTRGAFTGADQSRLGRIHAAHGGTLLLDEVGELPVSMQCKLLRFVQGGEVQRLGSADIFRVDVRLIASTNADLLKRVRENKFREDFYYRLAVFPLDLPPLRERSEDILPVARYFLEILCRRENVPQKAFSTEAENVLQNYLWPGNVRELQHWIERAFVLAEESDQIQAEDLAMPARAANPLEPGRAIPGDAWRRLMAHDWPANVRELENALECAVALSSDGILTADDLAAGPNGTASERLADINRAFPLAELERRAVLEALLETRGDKLEAARLLQISKTTLYRRLKEYAAAGLMQA
jgi:DNA-binding NtrC family response regulator